MAAIVILTAICSAAVLFLVYFFMALCKHGGKRQVVGYLLRLDSEPQFDDPFEGAAKRCLSFAPIDLHHRLRRRQAVCVDAALPKQHSDFGMPSSTTLSGGRSLRAHRRVLGK